MAAAKIKKGDRVVVLSGKDKGKHGEVVRALRAQNVQVAGGGLDRPPAPRQGAYEVGV